MKYHNIASFSVSTPDEGDSGEVSVTLHSTCDQSGIIDTFSFQVITPVCDTDDIVVVICELLDSVSGSTDLLVDELKENLMGSLEASIGLICV
jgi:hypothetical protein